MPAVAVEGPGHDAIADPFARPLVALVAGEVAPVEAPQRRHHRSLVVRSDELDALPVGEAMVALGEIAALVELDLARIK